MGRTENDGNFVLSRFAIKIKDKELAIASATANYSLAVTLDAVNTLVTLTADDQPF